MHSPCVLNSLRGVASMSGQGTGEAAGWARDLSQGPLLPRCVSDICLRNKADRIHSVLLHTVSNDRS